MESRTGVTIFEYERVDPTSYEDFQPDDLCFCAKDSINVKNYLYIIIGNSGNTIFAKLRKGVQIYDFSKESDSWGLPEEWIILRPVKFMPYDPNQQEDTENDI